MTTTEPYVRDGNDLVDARASWLADPGSVHVAPSPGGGWDVVLRIDGTYTHRDDAQDVADLFQPEIHRIAAEARAAATHAYRQRAEVRPGGGAMATCRRHNCTRKHRTTRTLAACMFPGAAWVTGQGPFAVLAWCGSLTVTLHREETAARSALLTIDSTGCGGRCSRRHELVRLEVAP